MGLGAGRLLAFKAVEGEMVTFQPFVPTPQGPAITSLSIIVSEPAPFFLRRRLSFRTKSQTGERNPAPGIHPRSNLPENRGFKRITRPRIPVPHKFTALRFSKFFPGGPGAVFKLTTKVAWPEVGEPGSLGDPVRLLGPGDGGS